MAGERSARIVGVAARAAERLAGRLKTINDLYAPESAASYVRELQFEAYMAHFAEFGHWAPDPGCTHDVCLTAGAMVQAAFAQLAQQQVAQQQQGQPQAPS